MQNAFYPRDTLSRRLGLDPLRLRNCAQVAGIRLDGQYAVSMSQATPMPAEPPTPSAQQLAQWRALVERIRQGDRSQVVAWDETSAADTGANLPGPGYPPGPVSSFAMPRRSWSALSPALSRSFGWIRPKPA
jgi:hypothetical protein